MRNLSHKILTLALVLVPLQALSAATIDGDDSIAGLQAEAHLAGFAPQTSIPVTITPPAGDSMTQYIRTDAQGKGVLVIDGADTERAGRYLLQAQGGGNPSFSLRILPDRLDTGTSTIDTSVQTITPNGKDEAIVLVTLFDRFGNPLPGRPVMLIPSRTDDMVLPDEQETNAQGEQRFSVTTNTSGMIGLRAMDLLSGMVLDSSVTISAGKAVGNSDSNRFTADLLSTSGLVDHFEITAPDTMERDKEATKITVRAVDQDGNVVEDYTGKVQFTSTDAQATLPNFGSYTFKDYDLGVKNFPLVLKFRTPGTQKLNVKDSQDPSIAGTATIMVSGKTQSVDGTIQIVSPRADQTIGGTSLKVEGTAPPLINLVVHGGAQDVNGDSDENGRFSIPITLEENVTEATISMEDDQGRYNSPSIHIFVDNSRPDIGNVTFTPEHPETGMQTLVVLKSEPGLRTASMKFDENSQPVQLAEKTTDPGTYQAFFTAPAAGSYQPTFNTTDKYGNTAELMVAVDIDLKSLPVVQGLTAEARTDSVTLQWTQVEVPVDGYRIYVGENRDSFLYTLDTGVPQTKATVKGLLAGHTYVFAVTALKSGQESKEKSVPAEVQTIGINLQAVPQEDGLQLTWSGMPSNLPLQSYILEFGSAEGAYTEKRVLNGEVETYTLHDLLAGVTYFVRLTPITVTGQTRTDLAATTSGIPGTTGGIHFSASDPVPGDISLDSPIIGAGHEGAPSQLPNNGLPLGAWIAITGMSVIGFGLFLQRRHRLQQSAAFMKAIQSHYNR